MPAVNRQKERELTASHLRSVLDYNPETGIFRWIEPQSSRLKPGDVAGNVRKDGRRSIRVGYKRYLASRLAWLYVYGEWPEGLIDHKDRNRGNDAISNLREATSRQNNWNGGVRSHNSLGLRNIHKHRKRFDVRFCLGGRTVYRKRFESLEEAVRARDAQYPLICGTFSPSSPDRR